jgi:hypothetical protein
MTLALVLSAAIGLSLGLLGSGGSIITLPVLVYAGGIPPREAVPMSLAIVGGAALAGTALHLRERRVHPRAAATFAVAGMPAAVGGAQLTPLVPPEVLLVLFAVVMFVVAGTLLLRQERALAGAPECHPARCLAAGAGVGALTGFLGVGGGFLIVPAMIVAARLPLKIATGTSLAVIAVNAFAGLAGQMRHAAIDPALTAAFLAVALIGTFAGVRLSARIATPALRQIFAWFVVAIGLFVVVRNVPAILEQLRP